MAHRLEKSQKKADRSQVERQIGRLLQRNTRAAAKFTIVVKEDPSRASGLQVTWREKREWSEWATLSEGAYILRSNISDWKAEDLWQAYMQLTEAEGAFRIHKSDLKLRPVWHHKAERVEGHILVSFLAYVLWKTLAGWQANASLGSSPRTVLEEFRRIQSVDVILPLEEGREIGLRCVVEPDKAQRALIQRLGLRLPKRLRPVLSTIKM